MLTHLMRERSDLETVIADLMAGEFNEPIRVVAFNTSEKCAKVD
jgi:hypothetical protein